MVSTRPKTGSTKIRYNDEDLFTWKRFNKTAFLMSVLVLFLVYFVLEGYRLLSNIFYTWWIRNITRPNWFQHAIDAMTLSIKALLAYGIFKWLNTRLLLQYDDYDELKKYN
ncbi:hypothetical protein DAMA08_029230 [Martiniozyma asiatica (nom. inval.)]|nr:hypothetical protein DAMA08_029230 [Martiniozyma asiatica]